MIEVVNIWKRYKEPVLKGATLSVDAGECVGILGKNGCGKSTLLSIMAGAVKADKGTISYNKEEATKDKRVFSNYTGFVPQENPIIEELSVKDNLRLWYLKKDFPGELLDMLGLREVYHKAAGKLSGGMKKRLSIGCALVNQPPVLILDEPGAALDLVCKEEIRQYLQGYLEHGGTIVMTTHEEAEMGLCSKLYIMQDGVLEEVPKDLRGQALIKKIDAQ